MDQAVAGHPDAAEQLHGAVRGLALAVLLSDVPDLVTGALDRVAEGVARRRRGSW
ncbi:hypothetical protein GCM10023200_57390 [Actinomycetospora chlora]|uniref:MftR C-terminal domain-containing protein n=1 Tax=Actinomycetospora chlora TaxID=663608 RepID=A0ABP9CK39_9PSEU